MLRWFKGPDMYILSHLRWHVNPEQVPFGLHAPCRISTPIAPATAPSLTPAQAARASSSRSPEQAGKPLPPQGGPPAAVRPFPSAGISPAPGRWGNAAQEMISQRWEVQAASRCQRDLLEEKASAGEEAEALILDRKSMSYTDRVMVPGDQPRAKVQG